MQPLRLNTIISVLIFLCQSAAFGGVDRPEIFPVPAYVKQQVQFWEAIFQKYPNHTTVIHDNMYPAIIIDVVDFKAFAQRYHGGVPYTRRQENDIVERYLKRYQQAIKRFAQMGKRAATYGAMEERIAKVYSNSRQAEKQLLNGTASIRSQAGLKDEFALAAKRAQSYLPYMEQIFQQYQLPIELTRLPFVESMFNLNAYSKVGASGIWQFMPKTGRLYMTVGTLVDERNSPLKATEGAARLLRDNLQTLGSWPLAITAYNHGAGGLQSAVRRFGTNDFGVIARNYNSRSFGFASRNFYAEFLAAALTYQKFYQGGAASKNPMGISRVLLGKGQSIASIVKRTPLTDEILKRYNPDLKDSVFTTQRHASLPAGLALFVPKELEKKVNYSLEDRPARQAKRRQM